MLFSEKKHGTGEFHETLLHSSQLLGKFRFTGTSIFCTMKKDYKKLESVIIIILNI